jgi:hypothetical protein
MSPLNYSILDQALGNANLTDTQIAMFAKAFITSATFTSSMASINYGANFGHVVKGVYTVMDATRRKVLLVISDIYTFIQRVFAFDAQTETISVVENVSDAEVLDVVWKEQQRPFGMSINL